MPNRRGDDMEKFRQLLTQSEFRAFLGSIGYYRRFVTKFAYYYGTGQSGVDCRYAESL